MSRVYATIQDYADYTGEDPVDVAADPLVGPGLKRASGMVEEATLTAIYAVDDAYMPTQQFVIEAMRDAVCAQVQWFTETGDITGASQFASVSIGSVGLSGGAQSAGGAVPGTLPLAPHAVTVLRLAGLVSSQEPSRL